MERLNPVAQTLWIMCMDKLKVVVFGSFNAGKSSFIRSLDPESRHVDADNDNGSTTVALDYGRVVVGDKKVYLFGTPGQERFEFVRQILARGTDGAVVVVDSTSEIDDMTLYLCEWLTDQDIPFVVMLNKCDCPGSAPEKFVDVICDGYAHKISALTGENVHDSLAAFVNRLEGRSRKNK
jgi:small GTP-binding protein